MGREELTNTEKRPKPPQIPCCLPAPCVMLSKSHSKRGITLLAASSAYVAPQVVPERPVFQKLID